VIPFAVRLAVGGGRRAVTRLVLIGVAVALGVAFLLSTFAGINAVGRSADRQVWYDSGAPGWTGTAPVDPLWWWAHDDYYDGRSLVEFDVAATGPSSPVPPGLARLPGPGEIFASPALAALVRTTPADRLGARIPGRLVGMIGRAGLASPDALVAVVGRTPAEVAAAPGARRVTTLARTPPADCATQCLSHGVRGDAMTLLLAVVAGALIFPVLIFIGTATRLSAATREQRYAAMRLVGATPGQVAVLCAVESAVAAVAGTAGGFALFAANRPLLATVPFTGSRFFVEDLTLTAAQGLGVAVGVPVAAAVAARVALRRVTIAPLGVIRRVTPRPPRAWRAAPLVAGLGELAAFVGHRPSTTGGQTVAYLGGFLLVMVGLVLAGPWLTGVLAGLVARRARRPATLIAARRLADDPTGGFRSVSGLVLALFVTTATVAVIGTINHNRGELSGDAQTRGAVVDGAWPGERPMSAAAVPPGLRARLRAIPGVRGVAVVHTGPAGTGPDRADPRPWAPGLVACADLAQIPVIGRCPTGADVAAVPLEVFFDLRANSGALWPAAAISPARADALPVQLLYVTTDGSTAAMERARTVLSVALPHHTARTVGDWATTAQRRLAGWRRLADVVLATTLPIAGASLAVNVVAGMSQRRRPFAVLRLSGAPVGLLRRVVGLEGALPLLAVAAIAIATGFAAAGMFLASQMDYTLVWPGAAYWVLVAVGLAAALALVASTLPLLARLTGPDALREG
jgi:hypothetical protein